MWHILASNYEEVNKPGFFFTDKIKSRMPKEDLELLESCTQEDMDFMLNCYKDRWFYYQKESKQCQS